MEKTYKQFKDLAESQPLPVFTECWASWCLPCKQYDSILKEFAREYDGRCVVAKVNVDRNPKMSNDYEVQGLPTFMVVQGGEVKQRKVGSQSVNSLREMIEQAVAGDQGSEHDEEQIIEEQLKGLGYL